MFDPAYLDTLDESELDELYEQCRARVRTCRSRGDWGLASWWNVRASEVCDAIGRIYATMDSIHFVREQLTLADMPPRISPEMR